MMGNYCAVFGCWNRAGARGLCTDHRPAKAMEARRAATGTGAVEDDSAARQGLPETSPGGSHDR